LGGGDGEAASVVSTATSPSLGITIRSPWGKWKATGDLNRMNETSDGTNVAIHLIPSLEDYLMNCVVMFYMISPCLFLIFLSNIE
jgi:hypothetical protein